MDRIQSVSGRVADPVDRRHDLAMLYSGRELNCHRDYLCPNNGDQGRIVTSGLDRTWTFDEVALLRTVVVLGKY